MDEQGVVHTQSRTSLSLTEGGNPDPGRTVDGLWGHCAQRNEPDTEGQILPDSTHMRSLEESHSWGQKLGAWASGAGAGEWQVIA